MRAATIVIATLAICAAVSRAVTIAPYKDGLRLHPLSDLPMQNYTTLKGATVTIEEGYSTGDFLMLDYQGEFPISSTFDNRTGILFINGIATVSEYVRAIQDVIFTTTSALGGARRITWSFGDNTVYLTRTRHFYKFVPNVGVSWGTARDNCLKTPFMGMQGYLATVTSQEENDDLGSKAWISAWIAGQYNPNSTWTWVAGPEYGWPFWTGNNMYRGGMPVSDQYSAWGRFQPSDITTSPSSAESAGNVFIALQPSLYEAVSTWFNRGPTDGVQGYVCEYGGMDLPNVTAIAVNYAGSIVLEYGCQLFVNASDCANAAALGCAWAGASCVQTSCSQFVTQATCQTDPTCGWSTSTDFGLCVNTVCGQFDEPTCTAATGCTYTTVNNAPVCVPSVCSDMKTSCACAAQGDECIFRSGSCFDRDSLNCDLQDIVYLVDGSSTFGQSYGKFTNGFVGLVSILQESDQYLTGTDGGPLSSNPPVHGSRVAYLTYAGSSYTPAPMDITGSRTTKTNVLTQMSRSFPNSNNRDLTTVVTPLTAMFAAAGSTVSGRSKVVVVFASGALANTAAVRASLSTVTGVTFLGVAVMPTPTGTQDSIDAYNSLLQALPAGSPVISSTLDDVQSNAIFGMCDATTTLGAVAQQGRTPTFTCRSYTTQAACGGDATCGWDFATNMCRRSQCQSQCQTQCSLDSTCAWTNNMCVSKCSSVKTSLACQAASGCSWDATLSFCNSAVCNGNPTEDACIADTNNCYFNSSAVTKCKLYPCPINATETVCASSQYAPMCTFINQQCLHDPCKSRSPATCSGLSQCFWGPRTPTSGLFTCNLNGPCSFSQDEATCVSDSRCSWNMTNAPAACVPAVCTGLNLNLATAKSSCQKDSRCTWSTKVEGGRCEVLTCDVHQTACACSADDGCVWRNSTCKDSRYVQCPMIDLFFLVEASTNMLQDFGRHPNGFFGVLESIRDWSMDAPFAATKAATGFRMGIAGYGANAALIGPSAEVPPTASTVGNGTYFVSNPNAWWAPGAALSDLESRVGSYAARSGNQVALRPGLEAAKAMFSNKDAPADRQRVLVILGASPFTDGTTGSAIGGVVSDLEAMGVQIFSNIVRRFSTITPIEEESAQFMQPLASDPASTHFLFTQIEDLRDSLLDNFCDPSTPVGRSLGVSRDNTLPCSWLSDNADECQMQSNCVYNATAVRTCPLSTQCPNLDCQELPANLAGIFSCAQCSMTSGVIKCTQAPQKQQTGLCTPNPCALNYCTQSTCGSAPGGQCEWNAETVRCNKNLCSGYSTDVTCNGNYGCYWSSASSQCLRSESWRFRSMASCVAVTEKDQFGTLEVYRWDQEHVPALCIRKRCENFNQQLCQAHANDLGCIYDTAVSPPCQRRTCGYSSSLSCASDTSCYWDPFDSILGACQQVPVDGRCVLSQYSSFSQCTATCGSGLTIKSRKILLLPDPQGSNPVSCPDEAAEMGANTPDTSIVVAQSCSGLPADCTSHCSSYGNDQLSCARDISCRWKSSCVPVTFQSCSAYDQASCETVAYDVCAWDLNLNFCVPVVRECTALNTTDLCNSVDSCTWRTGNLGNSLAATLNVPVQLYNPGPEQKPIFVFPELAIDSNTIVNGAIVAIEKSYQRNKDILRLQYPSAMNATWSPAAGTLTLTGAATISDYANAISYVTFETTSTSVNPRVVTWALLSNTVYSGVSQHVFQYFPSAGVMWEDAKAACAASNYFGLKGYLAVIDDSSDNTIISSKLWAAGWISGTDTANSQWTWSTGPYLAQPLQFWDGPSASSGGRVIAGMYANWDNNAGQPSISSGVGTNHIYLDYNGLWYSQDPTFNTAAGYICEYGGMLNDPTPPFEVAGATVIGAGGCIPQPCVYHSNEGNCTLDSECSWDPYCLAPNNDGTCNTTQQISLCQPSCNSKSTPTDCNSDARCSWDTTTSPATCSRNPCAGSPMTQAICTSSSKCAWSTSTGCQFKTGCAALLSQSTCQQATACSWSSDNTCAQRACYTYNTADDCGTNPLCTYVAGAGCSSALCRAGDRTTCLNQRGCQWGASSGNGTVSFTPGGLPIQPFATLSSTPGSYGNTVVEGLTVMITDGYQVNRDWLILAPNALGTSTFDGTTGTLVVSFNSGVNALEAFSLLQNSVSFVSNARESVPRSFAYTLEKNAFKSASGAKYIKYRPFTGGASYKSFTDANTACQASSFFGVSGRLASIAQEMDAVNLARFSPTAWIGAQGNAANEWTWTLRSPPLTFWSNGIGSTGPVTTTNGTTVFAFWAQGEPAVNDTGAIATSSGGRWVSVNSGSIIASAGVICEYDALVETGTSKVSFTQQVKTQGCYQVPCVGLGSTQCAANPNCRWSSESGQCSLDAVCAPNWIPSSCNDRASCFWNYDKSTCERAPATSCTGLPQDVCTNTAKFPECGWVSKLNDQNIRGACDQTGCNGLSKVECASNSNCVLDPAGLCMKRLCGYTTRDTCMKDNMCTWLLESNHCEPDTCRLITSKSLCLSDANCEFNYDEQQCQRTTCPATASDANTCQLNPVCLFANGKCTASSCANYNSQQTCDANKAQCEYVQSKTGTGFTCVANQCTNYGSQSNCEEGLCNWDASTGSCLRSAPEKVMNACEREIQPNLWWLWLLVAIIAIILVAMVWRLYLAFSKGMSFFEPARKNVKYSPHEQYRQDLFEEAQTTAVETNEPASSYQRPNIADL
jgi:hypothetical protein